MRKTIVIIAIVGMILVSFASAGLVDFLSNVVTGTVEVKGPVFYISSGQELIMNRQPSSLGADYSITGQDERTFKTNLSFGGIDFYKPTIKFVIDLEINNLTLTDPRGIDLDFGYMDGKSAETLCAFQYISITSDDEPLEVECPILALDNIRRYSFLEGGNPSGIDEFYLSIGGMSNDDIVYTIKKDTSYVEITGVYDE